MKYLSTRNSSISLSFEEVLFSGYSNDGGLYMPERIPKLSINELESWSNLNYLSLMKRILRLYISSAEISTNDLEALVDTAFSGFATDEVIPIKRLNNGLNVAELFHGETLAFKDLALSVMAQLMNYFLKQRKRHVIVLVGTSGDTGSAVIHSIRKCECLDVIVLFPKNLITHIQELQMTTVLDNNVHCYSVEGTSDDLDVPIKDCFIDSEFASQHNLCCANSINWARIMAQITKYFYIYFQLSKDFSPVEMIVPTGAAGSITAGCIAKLMGLPINICSCVNANQPVLKFWKLGELSIDEEVHHTVAPAMDIQVAYNLERILFLATRDSSLIKDLFSLSDSQKKFTLTPDTILKCQSLLSSVSSYQDSDIKRAILQCWHDNEYPLCPHTATAVAYHYEHVKNENPPHVRVCLATASPDKFPEVLKDLNIELSKNPRLEKLMTMPTRSLEMKRDDPWTAILKNKIQEITKLALQ